MELFEQVNFTNYKYIVSLYLTTFGKGGETEPFKESFEFKDVNLSKARVKALNSYFDILKGIATGKASYFLPICEAKDFVLGENSSVSLHISLVEITDHEENEFLIYGCENWEEMNQDRVIETKIFEEQGYKKPFYFEHYLTYIPDDKLKFVRA